MNTSRTLPYLLTGAALAGLTGCNGCVHTPRRPNVLLIVADDLGYGDVSAYGQQTISTPNIDRLAHEGACFLDGHSTSATSTPSRYGLFTGIYPWKAEGVHILPGDAPLLIDTLAWTMPKMFQEAGYRTGAIGKWHLGMGQGTINWNRPISPSANRVGFDYTYLIAATVDRVPTVYVENGSVAGLAPDDTLLVNYRTPFPGEPTALTHPELVKMPWSHGHNNTVVGGIPRIGFMKGGQSAWWDDTTMAAHLVECVKRFIDNDDGRPFFLYYGMHQPHVPRTPMSTFAGTTPLGPRGDVIVEADWCIGEVLEKLDNEGLLENTLIIFTSDNGPVLDDGYVDGAREPEPLHDPKGGLRGGKYSLYDAGTRVPFFLYWKGHIRHFESHALVSHLDIPASLGALIGAEVPDSLDTQNRLSTFLGRSRKGRSSLVIEAQGRLALRHGRYALIPPYKGKPVNITGNEMGIEDHYALYDLRADPSQRRDLSARHPRLTERLRKEFLSLVGTHYDEQKQP